MKPESPFAVGEIAIYHRPGAPHHNTECEIVSELIFGYVRDLAPGTTETTVRATWYHQIDGNFGPRPPWGHWCAEIPHLRKRPGHGDLALGKWADCVFDPNRLIIKL